MKASEKVTTYNAYVTGPARPSGSSSGTTRRATSASRDPVRVRPRVGPTCPGTSTRGRVRLGPARLLLAGTQARVGAARGVARPLGRARTRRLGLAARVHARASLVLFLATPIFSAFSRYCEHQADVYGLEVTHGLFPDSPQVAASAVQARREGSRVSDPEPAPRAVELQPPPARRPHRVHPRLRPLERGAGPGLR